MLPAKSTLLEKILDNAFVLLLNGQGQTCVTSVVHSKLLLTKYWNEVLHQFKVATGSSNVEDIVTILLMDTLMIISLHLNTILAVHIRIADIAT